MNKKKSIPSATTSAFRMVIQVSTKLLSSILNNKRLNLSPLSPALGPLCRQGSASTMTHSGPAFYQIGGEAGYVKFTEKLFSLELCGLRKHAIERLTSAKAQVSES